MSKASCARGVGRTGTGIKDTLRKSWPRPCKCWGPPGNGFLPKGRWGVKNSAAANPRVGGPSRKRISPFNTKLRSKDSKEKNGDRHEATGNEVLGTSCNL